MKSAPSFPVCEPRPHRRAQAGFTVAEVIVAVFILALGISTSIVAIQTGFKSLDLARNSTLASQIMQSEIERLRLWPWNNTSTTAVDSIAELPASQAVSLSTMFSANPEIVSKFTVTRTVADDTTRPGEVRYITVSVTWKSYDGRSHTRSFTTMYAKNGLYDYYYTLATS
jgi:hypothetical protein